MSLKFQMDSMEGVDPAVAALYEEQDNGKFVLTGIDNIVHRSKIDDFRTNNIVLNNKLAEYKGVKPEDITNMRSELEEARIRLEQKGDVDDETVQRLVEARVTNIQKDAKETQTTLEAQVAELNSQLEREVVSNSINSAAVKHKVAPEAMMDVMLRAQSVFKLVDGKPVAYDSSNQKMFAPDGVTELTIDTWVKGLKKTSPHLFLSSKSSGIRNVDGKIVGDPSKMTPMQKISAGLS